ANIDSPSRSDIRACGRNWIFGRAGWMRIIVTRFFRERQRWDTQWQVFLNRILQKRAPGKPLRVWGREEGRSRAGDEVAGARLPDSSGGATIGHPGSKGG
ncbi:MAG: hypothetical protein P8Z70_07775, partial [Desulfuromonadales bacterium]